MSTVGSRKAEVPPQAADFTAANVLFNRIDGANRGLDILKNGLINPAFDFWQRGTLFSAPGYGPDRYNLINPGTNGTYGISRQAFAFGDIPSESVYYARFSVTGNSGSSDGAYVQHPIEGVRRFAGKRVVIRGYARRNAGAGNVAVELSQNFGTGGSATVSTPAQQINLTASWAPFFYAGQRPSIVGLIIGTANDFLGLNFWLSGGSAYNARTGSLGLQNITVDLADLEIKEVVPGYGDAFPGFERIPRDMDYQRVLRFYQKSYDLEVAPGSATYAGLAISAPVDTTTRALGVNLMAPLRTAPSNILTWDGAGNSGKFSVRGSGWTDNQGSFTLLSSGTKSFIWTQSSSGLPVGIHYAVSAEY